MVKLTPLQAKRRYQVDLMEQQALGEINYAHLQRLMPNADVNSQWLFSLASPDGDWRISIRIDERARFTTSVLISRHQGECRWTQSPTLKVRLYHDATMAEVVAWERHRVIQGRYSYPNKQMYQCDEKVQLNRFLGEWLSHCLAEGQAEGLNLKLTG